MAVLGIRLAEVKNKLASAEAYRKMIGVSSHRRFGLMRRIGAWVHLGLGPRWLEYFLLVVSPVVAGLPQCAAKSKRSAGSPGHPGT